MTPIRANIVGPPDVATKIRASIAACHSAASCSAFGSFVMKLPASSSVTRWRPPGSGIGSSNDRFQPRPLMAPTLLVELGSEAFGQPRYFVLFRLVTPRAGRPGGRRRCRRVRLPTADRDGFHKPSRSPHKRSISWLAKLTRTFATNLPYVRFGHASRAKGGWSDPARVVRTHRAPGRFFLAEIRADVGAFPATSLAGEEPCRAVRDPASPS
jgi:hypothetical protein